MRSSLARECAQIEPRARSLRITAFQFVIDGETVILDGEAMTPEGVDSIGKLFASTSAREVVNRVRHAPADPARPGAMTSPGGYVHVENLGPDGARLAETIIWLVEPGNTVAGIAQAIYGDASKVERILRANRFTLGATGGHLTAGMKLRIPPP